MIKLASNLAAEETQTTSTTGENIEAKKSAGGDPLLARQFASRNETANRQQGILAMQRTQGNAAVRRHLAGVVQREKQPIPTSAVGLILRFDHANVVDNWCQVQADNIVGEGNIWERSGLRAQLLSVLSGPGYWQGHHTWAPREAVVDLGLLSNNVGVTVTLELLQDNESILGSRGRVGLQSQSSGQANFGNSAESSQSTSAGAEAEHGSVSGSVSSESSTTHGSSGELALGGQSQATVSSRNSTAVTAELFVRASISLRLFDRFTSGSTRRATNTIHVGTVEYVDPTHRRHVAIPHAPRRLRDRQRN